MIYLDLLFLLNFGYDFLLLLTTGIILKRIFKLKRLILASIFGAISTFVLLINFPYFQLFILKILISIVMIIISFGKKNILINIIYLYMNSVILAGFLYYLTIELSYKRVGLNYYFDSYVINYVVILLVTPIILYIYTKQIKLLKEKVNLCHKVTIVLKSGIKLNINGFIDSGNKLKDPISKKYIIIIDKEVYTFKENPIYVPFKGVNKKGLLKCFSIKYIEINNQKFTNYLIGVTDNKINLEGSSCILNYKLMEDLNV